MKILSQSPDRGNLTPRRQGHVGREASRRGRARLYAGPHREGGSERSRRCVEVQAKAKRRKARLHRASRPAATMPRFCRRCSRIGAGVSTKFGLPYPTRSAGPRSRGTHRDERTEGHDPAEVRARHSTGRPSKDGPNRGRTPSGREGRAGRTTAAATPTVGRDSRRPRSPQRPRGLTPERIEAHDDLRRAQRRSRPPRRSPQRRPRWRR